MLSHSMQLHRTQELLGKWEHPVSFRHGWCAECLRTGRPACQSCAVCCHIHYKRISRRSFLAGGSIQSASGMAGMLSASALGVPLCVWLFCGLIVLSRIAFWTFDMVDAQILQTVSLLPPPPPPPPPPPFPPPHTHAQVRVQRDWHLQTCVSIAASTANAIVDHQCLRDWHAGLDAEHPCHNL